MLTMDIERSWSWLEEVAQEIEGLYWQRDCISSLEWLDLPVEIVHGSGSMRDSVEKSPVMMDMYNTSINVSQYQHFMIWWNSCSECSKWTNFLKCVFLASHSFLSIE